MAPPRRTPHGVRDTRSANAASRRLRRSNSANTHKSVKHGVKVWMVSGGAYVCAYRWCHDWAFFSVSSESYALDGTSERFQAYDTPPPLEDTEGKLLWRATDPPTTARVSGMIVSFANTTDDSNASKENSIRGMPKKASIIVLARPYPASPVILYRPRGASKHAGSRRFVCDKIRSYAEMGKVRFMYTHSERDTHFAMLLGDNDAAHRAPDPLVVSILTKSGFPPQGLVDAQDVGTAAIVSERKNDVPRNDDDDDESEDSDDSYDASILRLATTPAAARVPCGKVTDSPLARMSPKRACSFDFVARIGVSRR